MKLLVTCLLWIVVMASYAQTKPNKIQELITKLEIGQVPKTDLKSKLEYLKTRDLGDYSNQIKQLENKLTDSIISNKIKIGFQNYFSESDIDKLYKQINSDTINEFYDSESLDKAISAEFVSINKAIAKLTDIVSADNYYTSSTAFTTIPVDREDGFYALIDYKPNSNNKDVKLEDNPAILISDILNVSKVFSDYGYNQPEIAISLTEDGTRKLYTLTSNNIGQPIAIVINKQIVSLPVVNSVIKEGHVSISNAFSEKDIDRMIKKLKGD